MSTSARDSIGGRCESQCAVRAMGCAAASIKIPLKFTAWSQRMVYGRESSLIRMKRNRCSVQRLPIPGGTAKKCCIPRINFRRRVFLPRRWSLPLFFGCAVLGACAAAVLWRSARRTRILLLEMRRRRSWANRNSGRTARFATGWARGAAAGDLI